MEETKFKVIVKTNSNSNEIIDYDKIRKTYKIKLRARPIEAAPTIKKSLSALCSH